MRKADPSQSPLGKGGSRGVGETSGERFEKALEDIRENVGRLALRETEGLALSEVEGVEEKAEREHIRTKRTEMDSIDIELRKEFAVTEKKLKDAKLPKEILDRHYKFVKHYEDNIKELKANLDDVEKAKTKADRKARIEKAKLHLEKTKPPKKHVPLDPNKLPFRTVKGKERAPRLKKEEFEKEFGPQRHQGTKTAFATDGHGLTRINTKEVFSHELSRIGANGPSSPLTPHVPRVLLAYNDITSDVPLQLPRPSGDTGFQTQSSLFSVPSVNSVANEVTLNSELGTLNLALASDAPTAADLSETFEVQFTPEIRAKAQELGDDPLRIYEWVRNNIEFVPTYGSIQGAGLCLQTRECNALDTASLLIVLLRLSNISARYVYGTIEIPADKFMNWAGGFSNIQSAISFAASAGIPVKPLMTGNVIAKVQMEHPWVEAWIDYNPSRGARHREGDTWIPLDASFKQHNDITGINIPGSVALDAQAFLQALRTGSTADESNGSVSGGSCAATDQLMENYRILAGNYLTQQHPTATIGDVLGSKEIVRQEFPYLLGTLPYRVYTAGVRASEMPDSLRQKAVFRLTSDVGASFEITQNLPGLSGKKITLGYVPATPADRDVILSYLPQTSGVFDLSSLPSDLPAYLINVKAELRIDGIIAATGPVTGLGKTDTLFIDLSGPDQNTDSVSRAVTAGEFVQISLNTDGVSLSRMRDLEAKLADTRAKLLSGASGLTREDLLGDLLQAAALAFSAERDLKERLHAKAFGVTASKAVPVLLASSRLDITWSLGMPLKAKAGGLGLDLQRDGALVASLSGDQEKEKQFRLVSGMDGSGRAAGLFDELFGAGPSASAVRALQAAKAAAVPIHTVNQANIATVLPLLQLDEETTVDIRNAVNAGMVIVVPRSPVSMSGRTMNPIVLIDPSTGSSAYFILNNVNGSLTWPSWSTLSPVTQLAWDSLVPSLSNLSLSYISDPFIAAFQAVRNGLGGFSSGVPAHYTGLLTEGLFYAMAAGGLGCYLTPPASTPAGPCMAAYLGSLCIADSSGSLGTGNAKPMANAGPDRSVMVGSPVSLDGSASTDRNSDPLTYSWTITSKPETSNAVIIEPATVTASFTPDVPGGYTFQLVVSDGKIMSDPASVTIKASYEMVSVPNLSGRTQQEAESLIIASRLSVGAITESSSGTVTTGTVLSQDPAPAVQAVKGSLVKIILSTGPSVDAEKPVLTAVFDRTPSAYAAGEIATLYIDATDNSKNVAVTVTMDGESRTVTPPSTAIDTTGMPPGSVHAIQVQAADPSNNTATVSLKLGIQDPSKVNGPVAEIITPALDAEVTAPTAIIGTVATDNLLEYTLSYAAKGTTTFTPFAGGTTTVTNGTLGTLEPTLLKNGIYDVRLHAVDTNGRQYWTETTYRVTGDMKVGNFTVTFTDLSVPVTGLPVTVNRTYDSRDKKSGDFGIGWTVDIQNTRLDENRTPGDGWPQKKQGGAFGQYCIQGDTDHYVSVNLPDGRTEEFDVKLNPNCQRLAPVEQTSVSFTSRPGTTSTLKLKESKLLLVANGMLLDPDTVAPFDPTGYVLTDKDGMVYDLDQSFGVRSVTDPNGNKLTYSTDGVNHSAGAGVKFVRDNKNRITTIIAPDGNKISYAYNSKGELTTVTDMAGNVTTYTYNRSHGLTEIKDPRGITPVKNEYDESGRLVAHTDSYGKRIEYTHDIAGRQEVVKDRNGNLTVYIYDEKGRVLQKTDPMGNKTSFTYDAVGNKLSETDPLGNTTTWTYDGKKNVLSETKTINNATITTSHTYNSMGKVLTTTDPLGHVTTNTYDAKGNLLTTTDALGKVTTNTYAAKGNLLTAKDAFGNVTSYSYDAAGRRISETNASGTSYYTYDGSGNKLSDTDRRGNTTLYTYDKNGKLILTTNAQGAVTRMQYDTASNKVADINPLGAVTRYYYDSANRLVATEYPDGTFTKTTFDNEGNRIASIDQLGRITIFEYNGNKQLVNTIYPDQTTRQFGYNAAGRQTTITDALGNVTTKEYDALGRVSRNIDPEGNTTSFAYDSNGNQIGQTDPNNHTTTFAFNELNRLITTTLPGGQATTIEYDVLGRKTAEIDAAENRTRFEYDAQGNLIKVTDTMGGGTRYEYDANNNRTAIIDARGNSTTFAYDSLNRLISKTMPNGGSETYEYNAAGRQTAKTDARGRRIAYGYDSNNRLTTRTYPDSTAVTFSYTATGKRNIVTDKRGATSYTYDTRDRLTKHTYPDGQAINYTYDLTGRLHTINSSLTGTTTYNFSGCCGRLKSVTDPQGNMTTYTYDPAGNRTGLAYPNGTTVSYTYDINNRLTNLTHRNTLSAIIASYAYTLGAIGNRIRIDEASGISRQYQYDNLYRLTREQVIDPTNTQAYQANYSYDAVGNRQNRTSTPYNQTAVSNDYTYNSADQLLTENGITYTYDLSGNLVTKTDSVGMTTYEYNYEDKLAKVTSPTNTITYQYDADGSRVSSTTLSGTTRYLVDTNLTLAQILAEYTTTGTAITTYVYAEDLISMKRSGVVSYYHFDGRGSTRLLADSAGSITDTFDYDAFGNLTARIGSTQNAFLFTGQQYDANVGFYYLRARYYQADTGRFTALDPFAGDPYAPASLHKYSYAANDPVNKMDPSGESFGEAVVALAMITVILTMAIFKSVLCDNQVTTHPNQLPYDTIKNLVVTNNLSGRSNELITCQCWKESGFNPNAQGVGSSARGLMQVTKGAAHDAGYSYSQLLDPATNIRAGSKYLKIRIQWAGGDLTDGLDGYGTGEGYASNIIQCESCLKSNPCSAKLCLRLIHQ